MTEATPNLNTKEGRRKARMLGISYDVTVRGVRIMWSPEQAERLAAQIPATEDAV